MMKEFKPKLFSVMKNYSGSQLVKDIVAGIIVAIMRPCVPSFITMPATIVAKAAVGPAICTLLPPRNDTMNPATIAV